MKPLWEEEWDLIMLPTVYFNCFGLSCSFFIINLSRENIKLTLFGLFDLSSGFRGQDRLMLTYK